MHRIDEQMRLALEGDPSTEAVEFQGRWFSWAEMKAVADTVAQALDEAKTPKRALVCLVPRNRPSAIAAEIGLIAEGRTIRMIYAFQSPVGIARDVARARPAAVVAAAEDFTPELMAVVREQGLLAIALEEMASRIVSSRDRADLEHVPTMSAEPEIQVHTSGTTGAPKHVGFSYDLIGRYIVGQHVSMAVGAHNKVPPVLLIYPLGNISGIYTTVPALVQRRRAVLVDRFTMDGWRDYVRRFRPATLLLPPSAFAQALEAQVPIEELECLDFITTGAAPLDTTVQQRFQDHYGIPILPCYGATEFGGPVTTMTLELFERYGAAKLGTVGRPYAGANLRVVDPETFVELPRGQEGLLEVLSPPMGDEWIRTTDIAILDEDDFLFHRGRADGAIVRGGFKLLPEAIERALMLHPAVADVAVVGLADERLGEVPVAVVQLADGYSPSAHELEGHLRQHVYATHIPVRWAFVDAIPRTTSMKTDLAAVRAMFNDDRELAT